MKNAIIESGLDWTAIDEMWIGSDLSQREFCRLHGFPYQTFLKKRRHYIQNGGLATEEPASSFAEFIPVSIEPPARLATPEIVVELPIDKRQLLLPTALTHHRSHFDPDFASRIMSPIAIHGDRRQKNEIKYGIPSQERIIGADMGPL